MGPGRRCIGRSAPTETGGAAVTAGTLDGVTNPLRNPSGEPNLRGRILAALVIVGLVVLTAPLVVLPVLRAVGRLVF